MAETPASSPSQRFLEGMMTAVELPHELLEQDGTTIAPREGRVGTGLVLCYRVGRHAVVWLDPALGDRFADLASPDETVSPERFSSIADDVGLHHIADAQMKVLPSGSMTKAPVPSGYGHEILSAQPVDDVVARVRRLTEHCTEQDVEEAALDELDEFDEKAINVLTPPSDPSIVAYGSAAEWEWDAGYADIGVLVHPDHRKRGLGAWVVAATTADLLADGILPLYRHHMSNVGSDVLSASLGFEVVGVVQAYQLRPAPDKTSEPEQD